MQAKTPTVLILGAQGRFGAEAMRAFAKAGWQVRAQTRRPAASGPAGVQWLQIDAMQGDELCRTAQGADVIVNALNPLYTQWETLARPLAANALAAARASGAFLMFPGNVYNFGRNLPEVLRLDTPQIGDTAKGRIRIDIEQDMQRAAAVGVNSVVLRAGDYFDGEGRGSWFDLALAASLDKGKLIYPGPDNLPHAWAYLPDLAACFVQLAQRREQLRGAHCFHFAGHTMSGADWLAAVRSVLSSPVRSAGLPWTLVRIMSLVSPMMRATLAMRYLWQREHRLDEQALRDFLGAVPHTPLNEAVAASLRGLGLVPATSDIRS